MEFAIKDDAVKWTQLGFRLNILFCQDMFYKSKKETKLLYLLQQGSSGIVEELQ